MYNIKFDGKIAQDEAKVGDIQYGTVLTNVQGHIGSIYMKVNKRSIGQGLAFRFPASGFSVLVNLKTGVLRAINGDQFVRVLDEELILREVTQLDSKVLK